MPDNKSSRDDWRALVEASGPATQAMINAIDAWGEECVREERLRLASWFRAHPGSNTNEWVASAIEE